MENLELNSFVKTQLKKAAQWAKFLSIVGFVFCGLFVLFGVISLIGVLAGSIQMFIVFLFYIILSLFFFFGVKYLYDFSTKINSSLTYNNASDLPEALKNLASHYKFSGIVMIIFLAFFFLSIFISFLGFWSFDVAREMDHILYK